MRMLQVEVRNPIVALALAVAAVAAGAVLVAIGVTLLVGVVAVGVAVGVAALVYRRVTGALPGRRQERDPLELEANAEILPKPSDADRRLPPG